MLCMTKEEARSQVMSLAPGASREAVEWGAEMMLIVARARGGQEGINLEWAWGKALEVSTKPHAAVLLDAVRAVPPKPELLPTGWEEAVQPV